MDSTPRNINPLKNAFANIVDILREESQNIRKLEQEKIDKLRDLFGLTETLDSVYYNEFNMYFFDIMDYRPFEYILPESIKLLSVEMPEYSQFIYILRYGQDSVLSSVLS